MTGIKDYNDDVLLLVILTMTYSEKVPVMVESKIIDKAMGMITKGELARANATRKQAHFGVIMSRLLQLPCKGARGMRCCEGILLSMAPDPTVPKEFCLDVVQGHVHTTQRVTLPPFGTINVHGNIDIQGHCI